MHNPFHDVLSLNGRKAVILDGGFGTELERQGKDYGQVMILARFSKRKFAPRVPVFRMICCCLDLLNPTS